MSRAAVLTWLKGRRPEPPADLAARLAQCVESAPDAVFAGESVAAAAGALGTWLVQSVVEHPRKAYDAALDLLAADAFVTYAFEAASAEGSDVTGLANRLLTRVRA